MGVDAAFSQRSAPVTRRRRVWSPPWWPFAVFALLSLFALDVLDSDRRIVVISAYVVLAAGGVAAVVAVLLFLRD